MAIEAQAAGVRKVFFRLLTPNGVAFSSSNMAYWQDIGIQESAIQEVLRGASPVFETIAIPDRKDEVRILYARLSPVIIVQVGQAMESHSRFLDAFKGIFIGTMLFLIVLAAGVGWFMARQAVSGVEAVTRTARMISGSSLEERVPVKARGDEIDQLAITFNQMLDRIQKLLTELKEMSDNIAHDLKSPITRMRGAAEVTLTTGKSLGEYEAMAASTIEECDRLLDMINTMLLISKTEAGVDKLSIEEIDLTRLVRDACELFQPGAEDKQMALSCEVPDGIRFTGDSRMIQRMLANLLDNAIKYTPPGGRVDVSVSNKDPAAARNFGYRHGCWHCPERSSPRVRALLPRRPEPVRIGHRAGPEPGKGHRSRPRRRYHRDERPGRRQHLHGHAAHQRPVDQ